MWSSSLSYLHCRKQTANRSRSLHAVFCALLSHSACGSHQGRGSRALCGGAGLSLRTFHWDGGCGWACHHLPGRGHLSYFQIFFLLRTKLLLALWDASLGATVLVGYQLCKGSPPRCSHIILICGCTNSHSFQLFMRDPINPHSFP